jgi:hypothetical protein
LCREQPSYLGEYGYLPDDELFFLSGALTASWRVLGNSKYWYRDEELPPEELQAAFTLYEANQTIDCHFSRGSRRSRPRSLEWASGKLFHGEGGNRKFPDVRRVAENVRGSQTSEMVFWSLPSEQRVRDHRNSI